MWKLSFPTCLVKYLLAATLAASNAYEEICYNSYETIWITNGKA
jgi:hypothetical protein